MRGLSRIRGALLAAGVLAVAALALAAPTLAAGNPDGVAVIIGNKTYEGRTPAVDFAHNDAEAMKRFVIDVLGFREGNIIPMVNLSCLPNSQNPCTRLAEGLRVFNNLVNPKQHR